MNPTSREAVIVIGDGCAVALAGGPLSLAELGDRTTKRVSHLEFNTVDNEWHVLDADRSMSLYSHADYGVALQWEIDHFNRLLSSVG